LMFPAKQSVCRFENETRKRGLCTRSMGRECKEPAEGTRTDEKCGRVLVRGVQREEEVALDMGVGTRTRKSWTGMEGDAIRCEDGGTRKKGGGIARRVRFQAVWWEGSRGRDAGERDSVGLLVNHPRMRSACEQSQGTRQRVVATSVKSKRCGSVLIDSGSILFALES
jgi:hypothetical protein